MKSLMPKPIVEIKILDSKLTSYELLIEPLKKIMDKVKNEGFIPIVVPESVEFSLVHPDDKICVMSGEDITVRDIFNAYYNKKAAENYLSEDDINAKIINAIDNVDKIKKYIDDINNLIQLVYPDSNGEDGEESSQSRIVLEEGWKEEAALRNNILYTIQSNNPAFAKLVKELMNEIEEEKKKEDGIDTDILQALNMYLQSYLASNNPDNKYRPVSINEIVNSYKNNSTDESEDTSNEETTEETIEKQNSINTDITE